MVQDFSRRGLLRAGLAGGVLLGTTACGSTSGSGGSATGAASAAPVASGSASAPAGGGVLATVEDLALSAEQAEDIAGRGLRLGFLTNNNSDDFSRTLVSGGEDTAEEYGIELVVNSANFDADMQLSQFNALVQQEVDGIFLTAVNADTIGTAVVRANDAGIPVFIVGGAPARGEVVSVMNAASYDGCFEAGQALMQRIDTPGATIAILGIPFALQTIRDREKGILDAVGEAGGQIVSLQSDFSQDTLLSLATNVIQANPELSGIFATWSLAVNAVTEAIAQSGRDIPFAGYDAEATGYQELAAGNPNLVALSAQQGYLQGRAAIEGLCQVVLGSELAPEIITPNLLVTPDNYDEQWDVQYPGVEKPF
jgi:ribose transport system substrate-binding protein